MSDRCPLNDPQKRILMFLDRFGPRMVSLRELGAAKLLQAGDVLALPLLVDRRLLRHIVPLKAVALTPTGIFEAKALRGAIDDGTREAWLTSGTTAEQCRDIRRAVARETKKAIHAGLLPFAIGLPDSEPMRRDAYLAVNASAYRLLGRGNYRLNRSQSGVTLARRSHGGPR